MPLLRDEGSRALTTIQNTVILMIDAPAAGNV